MSKILNIAVRSGKRQPMQQLTKAFISCEQGVEQDFRGKPGNRQVTLLDKKSWDEACEILGKKLHWTTRRSNILVDEIDLKNTIGHYLIAGQAVLQITQETDPCKRMEESEPGLFDALKDNWRGGVCCRVIRPGEIKTGDAIQILNREEYESKKQ